MSDTPSKTRTADRPTARAGDPSRASVSDPSPTQSPRPSSPPPQTRDTDEPSRREGICGSDSAPFAAEKRKLDHPNGDPKESDSEHQPAGTPSSTVRVPRAVSRRSSTTAARPDSTSCSTQQQAETSPNETALNVDDLLGPDPRRASRIAHASSSSSSSATASSSGPSQPASTHSEEDPHSRDEAELRGLGLDSTGCLEHEGGGGDVGDDDDDEHGSSRKPGTFRDGYFDDGEDTDESWLHYSSTSRRHEAATSSSNTSNSPPSHVSSSKNAFGSPLSPHVPPFSPGLIEMGQFGNAFANNDQQPWAPPSSSSSVVLGSVRIPGAREREVSLLLQNTLSVFT